MKGYFECGKCSHQWTREGCSMDNRCPACGRKGGRCEIGTMAKPDWYRIAHPDLSNREANIQKFNRIMVGAVVLGAGIYFIGLCFILVAEMLRSMP